MRKKGREYNIPEKIEILIDSESPKEEDNLDIFDTLFFENNANAGTVGTVGTQYKDRADVKERTTTIVSKEQWNRFINLIQNIMKNKANNGFGKTTSSPLNESQSSPSSQLLSTEQAVEEELTDTLTVDVSQHIYQIGHTDNWACKNCKLKGIHGLCEIIFAKD